MKTIIIEDEHLTAQRLQNMLHKYDSAIKVLQIIPAVDEAIEWFKVNPDPDVVFMDIHLEDEQCFNIFEKINLEVPVIFTTAYDEYMIKAFKVNSVDYLMKPVNYEELVNALEKLKRLKQQYHQGSLEMLLQAVHKKEPEYKSRFLIGGGSRLVTIEVEKIKYFYCADKITFLVTAENQHLPVDYSLDKLNLLLDPKIFFRVNRQITTNLQAIKHIHVYPKGRIKLELSPAFKKETFVSQDKIVAFKDWLGK
jgi:DNA-binding LytR/AlgR family response regulator